MCIVNPGFKWHQSTLIHAWSEKLVLLVDVSLSLQSYKHFYLFLSLRLLSCLTSLNLTCLSSQDSWRPKCLHPSLTIRLCAMMKMTKTLFWEFLIPGWIKSGCWTSGRRLCAHLCIRNAQPLMRLVRATRHLLDNWCNWSVLFAVDIRLSNDSCFETWKKKRPK